MTIILCFGNPDECQNCGGWVRAGGGPFPADTRFCSQDCFEDSAERAARNAARAAWCAECGYDCGEHAPDCPNTEDRESTA